MLKSLLLISLLTAFSSIYIRYTLQDTHTYIHMILFIDNLFHYFYNEYEFNLKSNRYLNHNFAPVLDENYNIHAPVISGSIPSEVNGLYMRIGPNPIPHHIGMKGYHWFDGHGMIHSLRIINGNVSYSNQYVETPRYRIERDFDRQVFPLVGEFKGIIGVVKMIWSHLSNKLALFNLTIITMGTANTAIVQYQNRLYACHEASLPFEIQWQNNNSFISLGYRDWNGVLNSPVNAHAKVDPRDGNMYFVGYAPQPGSSSVSYGVIRGNDVLSYVHLNLPETPWIHDMMITENYILLFVGSVTLSPAGVIKDSLFHFDDDTSFKIGVAHKLGRDVKARSTDGSDIYRSDTIQWFEAPGAAVILHACNAWEEGNKIILWTPLADYFDGTLQQNRNVFHMTKLTLDLDSGRMSRGTLARTHNIEFPRVHPYFIGIPSRFGFAGVMNGKGDASFEGFVKFDFFSKEIVNEVKFREGVIGGELVPISKRNPVVSDDSDGSDSVYLATFLYDTVYNGTEWVVYDGYSMSSDPIVRVRVPRRVPFGFHGHWVPEDDLQSHMSDSV